jgi:ribose-phosphate pyrophosphokinase
MPSADRSLKLFAGNANPELARSIADHLGHALGAIALTQFSDGEVRCQLKENVRGTDVFLIQPTCRPVNRSLMELLIMCDAARRASAARITAVMPYFGYARQDKKDEPRVPITAKLVADQLAAAGAERVLAMDLHAGQLQGFFNIPVDHLFAAPVAVRHFESMDLDNVVMVAPDAGAVERARAIAKRLHAGLAIIDKRRLRANKAVAMHVVGDVEGCNAILYDDMVDTAGTLTEGAKALVANGAKAVYAFSTHAVLSGSAVDAIEKGPFAKVIVTDTIPLRGAAKKCSRILVLSVAELLGDAIRNIHEETSLSSLFI